MISSYPCAVCGAPSTTTFEGVPLCPEHQRMAEVYLAHHQSKLEEMTQRMKVALREHVRTHLLEGKTL